MDLGALCAVLQAATSPVPEERKAAEQQLAQSLFAPGFLWALLQVVARNDVDAGVRQLASIHFKNIIAKNWKLLSDPGPTFSEEDRAAVRSHLLEALAVSPPQLRKQLSECLKTVVGSDFPEKWPGLLPGAMEMVQAADQQRLYAGLMAIRIIARKYEFKGEEERAPMVVVVDGCFPVLLTLLKHLITVQPQSLDVADYIKLILKVFWSACYLQIPPSLLQGGVFLDWMGCFQALLQQPVPVEGQPTDPEQLKAWPWWKVKKWLLHILNRLFNRFADPSRAKAEADKQFALLFQEKCAPLVLDANVALLSQLRSGANIPERITNLSLDYLQYCINRKKMYARLKPQLPMLLSDITFPLLCFGDADDDLWKNDPHEYVRKGYDFFEDMYSGRKGAIDFVVELVSKRSKEHLDSYLGNIVHIFTRFAAAPVEQKAWREKDGALLVVGALSDKLKESKKYSGQLEAMLVQHVYPDLHSPQGHLRAKSASFWKCMKLNESTEVQAQRVDTEEDDDDVGPLAAAGCLRAISTILESVSSLPHLIPQMEPFLVPILHRMLSTEGEEVIEEVLEIATLLTFLTPSISPQLWALWPLMLNCLKEFAIDFFDSMLGPFDNFISRGTEHFLSCPDPNYPLSLFEMVTTFLQDEKMDDHDILAAPKLLSSVLQNCRGRVDVWVEPYVLLCLQRLAKAETKSRYMKDLLLLVVADALYYNAPLTLGILQKHNAAGSFFQGWMAMIAATKKSGKPAHFKREYDKKVCLLGLTSVLSVASSGLPPELQQGQQQLLQAVLKLLAAYKEQEAETKRLEEAEEDEEEEDDDDEWVEAEEGEAVEAAEGQGQGEGEDDAEDEDDEAQAAKLKRMARRANQLLGMREDDDDDDEDDDIDWFTDDEEAVTPIDPIDPFIFFSDNMAVLQQQDPQAFQALFGTLDLAHQAMVHDVTTQTEERRKNAEKEAQAQAQAQA